MSAGHRKVFVSGKVGRLKASQGLFLAYLWVPHRTAMEEIMNSEPRRVVPSRLRICESWSYRDSPHAYQAVLRRFRKPFTMAPYDL